MCFTPGDPHGCPALHCPQYILQVNCLSNLCPFVQKYIYVEIDILINPLQIGTIALQFATSTVGSSSVVNLGLNLKN